MVFKKYLKTIGLSLVMGFSAQTAQAETDFQKLSLNVTEGFIIPTYERFANNAKAHADVWDKFCAEPQKYEPEVIKAFHLVNDDWQQIQHMTFGPITSYLRRDRLYHWPERRNAVSRALGKVLADKDTAILAPGKFSKTSVAVQGLPALERLIYDGETYKLSDAFTCQLGQAIAKNVAEIALGTHKDWTTGEYGVLEKIQKGAKHPIYFASMEEIANRYFTLFLTGFQIITDQKLQLPLGKSLEAAKPKRAEFWRSERSMRSIHQSAAGLEAMANVLAQSLSPEDQKQVSALMTVWEADLKKLPANISNSVGNPQVRSQFVSFQEKTKNVRAELIPLFSNVGLTAGFNSLDGD